MLVHIVADYGAGDLAFAEVVQRICRYLPYARSVLTPVPEFATLAAGFCVAQLGLNEAPPGTLIFHNVAPRADDEQPRRANAGERLAFARLPTGVSVIGVNAGYTFSFVRDEAVELRWVAVPAEGSQFRSRDVFPQAVAAIVQGDRQALAEPLAPTEVPDVPEGVIAYIDGYGNLKTTLSAIAGVSTESRSVRLRIAGREHQAMAGQATFAVAPGQLALAPGSSGWSTSGTQPGTGSSEVRWMEVFLRGGNAWRTFGCPAIGDEVEIVE